MRDCCADHAARCDDERRGGFTLAELLVTLALTGLLGGVVFSTLVVQLRLARVTATRAASNDAFRTAAIVLAGEVRRAAPADLRALATDSLALRSFRGLALRCPDANGPLIVRYRGDRLPDVRKDSVLLLTGTAARAVALMDSRATTAPCVLLPGESLLQWSVEADQDDIDDVVSALLFESGRYFLSSRALRYRLGAEGRQPLTAELFRHPGTSFAPDPYAVRFRLSIDGVAETVHAAPFAPPPHR